MISDTLHAAVAEIDRYLADEDATGQDYWGMYDRIKALRDQMDAMRCELDGGGSRPDPRGDA